MHSISNLTEVCAFRTGIILNYTEQFFCWNADDQEISHIYGNVYLRPRHRLLSWTKFFNLHLDFFLQAIQIKLCEHKYKTRYKLFILSTWLFQGYNTYHLQALKPFVQVIFKNSFIRHIKHKLPSLQMEKTLMAFREIIYVYSENCTRPITQDATFYLWKHVLGPYWLMSSQCFTV